MSEDSTGASPGNGDTTQLDLRSGSVSERPSRLAVERDDLGPPLRSWLRSFVADLPAEGASPS